MWLPMSLEGRHFDNTRRCQAGGIFFWLSCSGMWAHEQTIQMSTFQTSSCARNIFRQKRSKPKFYSLFWRLKASRAIRHPLNSKEYIYIRNQNGAPIVDQLLGGHVDSLTAQLVTIGQNLRQSINEVGLGKQTACCAFIAQVQTSLFLS